MRTTEQYSNAIQNGLAPQGMIMPSVAETSNIGRLYSAFALALLAVENEADYVLHDTFSDASGAFIADWERVLGLPREGITGLTIQQRRDIILAWLNVSEYSTKAFFVEIARVMGFTITVEDGVLNLVEVVTDGDFSSGVHWVQNGGWNVTGGQAVHTGTATDFLEQTVAVENGKRTRLTITFTGTSGGLYLSSSGFGGAVVPLGQSATALEVEVVCADDTKPLKFISIGWAGAIDSVSLLSDIADPFEFKVDGLIEADPRDFLSDISRSGEQLYTVGSNAPLEALIEFFAPAHTTPSFNYSANLVAISGDNLTTISAGDNLILA